MMIALLIAGAAPLVDPSVRELRPCRLESVTFRTPLDGQVATACGTVYRTRDGGRGWERDRVLEKAFGRPDGDDALFFQHFGFVRWYSVTQGFAGGSIGARVLRTDDAGETWTEARLPGEQWVYSVFTRGDSAWMCGSSGAIYRSDDRAKTWRATASPFDSSNRCMSIAFDSRGRAEAVGMNDSRWQSDDDGATWKHVSGSPAPGAATVFGGTWGTARGSQSEKRAQAGKVTATIDGQQLVFDEPGVAPRSQPLVSPGSRTKLHLVGVEPRPGGLVGWTASDLFVSDDSVTWYAVAALPAPVARLTFLNQSAAVLESPAGVFRTESTGRRWEKSTNVAIDLGDVNQARTKAPPSNPFACVATAQNATLRVDVGVQGCFGGSRRTLTLTVDGAGARTQTGAKLEPAKLRELVEQLGALSTRLEEPSGCRSTTGHTARLSWSCDGTESPQLEFTSHACGSEHGVAASTRFSTGAGEGYARALAIEQRVAALLTPSY